MAQTSPPVEIEEQNEEDGGGTILMAQFALILLTVLVASLI